MSTEASVRTFFSSPSFAVVGASSNPDKYGHKVFAWYTSHSLPVSPINPSTPQISVSGTNYTTIPSLSALPDPKTTSVSIITPPKATLAVLKEARELGVPSVWMQPGSFDEEVLKFAREGEGEEGGKGFKAVVAGEGGRGGEGWCVLVDGERGLRAAGKL
ncbi:CoA binding domain-containing protein [Coniochaeta sp. 2T2.1]|nr:CoA binding domain-containing protein [Coniochaeta sp. 2T2.1]